MAIQTQGTVTVAVPVLASLNIQESIAFYSQKLGFSLVMQSEDYAIVKRDGAELQFWRCAEPHIAQNTSCYLRVNGLQALYEEFVQKLPDLSPPKVLPWGMQELYILDVHGNLLKWGEPVPD